MDQYWGLHFTRPYECTDQPAPDVINDYLAGNALLRETVQKLVDWVTKPSVKGAEFEEGEGYGGIFDGPDIFDLWRIFNHIAESTQETQDGLVELLLAIKSHPDAAQLFDSKSRRYLFCLMDAFGQDSPDSWDLPDPQFTDLDRDTVWRQWINLNAFAARLADAEVIPLARLDLYAICALRDALEEPVDDSTNLRVRAAAQWLFYAGHRIYQCNRVYEAPLHGPAPLNLHLVVGWTESSSSPGRLWAGHTHGFCKERWAFWKQRFGVLGTHQLLLDDARRAAVDARQIMVAIEDKFRA